MQAVSTFFLCSSEISSLGFAFGFAGEEQPGPGLLPKTSTKIYFKYCQKQDHIRSFY